MNVCDLQEFRRRQVSRLTSRPGVYVLCDLDEIPVYVGQSKDGIRGRVRRHLTSARSDVIASRRIDIWEVAYVWSYPFEPAQCDFMEAWFYHHFNDQRPLINGAAPRRTSIVVEAAPEPLQKIIVIPEEEISRRLDPSVRAPRQAHQYQALMDYFLNVKRTQQIAHSMAVHFDRMREMHAAIMSRLQLDDDED